MIPFLQTLTLMMTFSEKIKAIDTLFLASGEEINGPADLKRLLEGFSFGLEELREHLVYPENLPYGRKCVFRSPRFEAIVMNWKPGQCSNIHDHGTSFGCVYAVSGKARNILFTADFEEVGRVPLIHHAIAEVPKGIFHLIENEGDDYAVTLHFYAPPLSGMKVIDKKDKSLSYIALPDRGAWNPDLENA